MTGTVPPPTEQVVRIKETNGQFKAIGVRRGDRFIAYERDETRHLFRGGSETAKDALVNGTACWGLDASAMDSLAEKFGVKYIEIPTKRVRYQTRMATLRGPKSEVKEFGGHRPQYLLNLSYWAEVPV